MGNVFQLLECFSGGAKQGMRVDAHPLYFLEYVPGVKLFKEFGDG